MDEAGLVSAALAWIGRGAAWLKVIANLPDLAAGPTPRPPTGSRPPPGLSRRRTRPAPGWRCTRRCPARASLVAAGADSIEHGWSGLDEHAVRDMARRGTAWTPTVGALAAMLDVPGVRPGRRRRFAEGQARIAELLPLAVRLGVPVLAGTDVTGSIPGRSRC